MFNRQKLYMASFVPKVLRNKTLLHILAQIFITEILEILPFLLYLNVEQLSTRDHSHTSLHEQY